MTTPVESPTLRVADALRTAAYNIRHRGWPPVDALRRATSGEHNPDPVTAAAAFLAYSTIMGESLTVSAASWPARDVAQLMDEAANDPRAQERLPR